MECLADVIQHARKLGLLVLLDGKRGDIGSTAEGYAEAYLGEDSPWQCDALTVNPYLGDDTLLPFFQRASATGTGIFVLVKTSNGGSRSCRICHVPKAAFTTAWRPRWKAYRCLQSANWDMELSGPSPARPIPRS